MQENPRSLVFAIINKRVTHQTIEPSLTAVIFPGDGVIFMRQNLIRPLSSTNAVRKYTVLDQGLEPASDEIELIAWIEPEKWTPHIKQARKPFWSPDIIQHQQLMGASFTTFRSETGLYTVYAGEKGSNVSALAKRMREIERRRN